MDITLVERRLASLESFPVWREMTAEQQSAYNDVPVRIDIDSPEELRAQLSFLETKDQQLDARQRLIQEIAGQDDSFLPLTYRLGAIAAFEATKSLPLVKAIEGGWIGLVDLDAPLDRSEQQIHPNTNPINRTMQIGDELERLSGILDTRHSVPVVMVWNHHYDPPRLDYDEVVLGEVVRPRESFELKPPVVIDADERKIVDYVVPVRLEGVKKTKVIRPDEYMQSEEKYRNPTITTLSRLVVDRQIFRDSPNALYIGDDQVTSRLAQAKTDMARYDQTMDVRRSRSRRSRSRIRR